MAPKKGSECNRKVSHYAASNPNCGLPFRSPFTSNVNMMAVVKLVTHLLVISQVGVLFGQTLSVSETINYINSTVVESPSPKGVDVAAISKDGYITIENFLNSAEKKYRYKVGFHWSEIEISQVGIDNLYINIPCRMDLNCIACMECGGYVLPTDHAYTGAGDSYHTKKLLNAWLYLLNKLNEDDAYRRGDFNDPFLDRPTDAGAGPPQVGKFVIPLSEKNGVYALVGVVGKTKLEFIFDSGASETSISNEIEQRLIHAGEISKDDYLSPMLFRLADGSITSNRRVKLRRLKIGDVVVTNLSVAIGGNNSPLLIGGNFLNRFKSWTLDTSSKKLTLTK